MKDRSVLSKGILQGWLLGVLLFIPLGAHAATNYYVRAGATGNSSGSDWNNAYTSLPSTLNRGSIYYIADGNYGGYKFSTPTSGDALITVKKATVDAHGSGVGWSNAYGDGQASFNGMFEFTTSNWVVDGQTGGGATNNWNQNFGFKVTETGDSNAVIRIAYSGTANNITMQHLDLQGKGNVSNQGGYFSNDGVAIYNASNILLSHYWMHGIGRAPFFLSAQNVTIEHGWVESYYGSSNVHSEVASIWGFDGSVGDITFRYNLFTSIKSTGGLMWDNSSNRGAHLYVYGNTFYKPPGAQWDTANGLIGGWSGGNGEEFRNAWVYNNSFINVDQESLSGFPNTFSGNIAYNNLFYNSRAPNFSRFGTHNYNHFINSGGTQGEANGTSSASGDPFVNLAGRDFRLKQGTASGKTLLAPFAIDPLAIGRGSDGTWDRGAFEFGGSSTPSLPAPTNLRIQ